MSKIPKKVINLLKNRQWYHQRFDGAPLYLDFIAEAEIAKEQRKPSGTEAEMRVVFFSQSGKGDWYIPMSDIRRGSRILLDLSKKDTNISTKILRKWHQDELRAERFFANFGKINVKKLSDTELIRSFSIYSRLFLKRLTSSAVIDHFALGTDQHIASMLRKEVGKLDKESQFTKIFSIATAPVRQSFINKAEMELLKIAIKPSNYIKALKQYQKKYFWVRNNYIVSKNLTVKDFIKEIALWRKSGADLRAKYELSKQSRILIKVVRVAFYLVDYKKELFTQLHWYSERLFTEISRRLKIPKHLVRYMLAEEVSQCLLKNLSIKRQLVQSRYNNCVITIKKSGAVKVFGGIKARLIIDNFLKSNSKIKKQDYLSGRIGNPGITRGLVRVIMDARKIDIFKHGEILVSPMTSPDYILAIRKAAAIVTDEGSTTCHAAIVSRELNIPCIVATQKSTRVFKTGDFVEVDANKGVVKLLKSS